jgi:hypothetical protein
MGEWLVFRTFIASSSSGTSSLKKNAASWKKHCSRSKRRKLLTQRYSFTSHRTRILTTVSFFITIFPACTTHQTPKSVQTIFKPSKLARKFLLQTKIYRTAALHGKCNHRSPSRNTFRLLGFIVIFLRTTTQILRYYLNETRSLPSARHAIH